MAGPIEQFEIKNLVPLGKIGGSDLALTNSGVYMLIALAVIIGFFLIATSKNSLVPGRLQSLAEMAYEFVANTVRSSAGNEGMRFFPLVFSLFMFVLVANLIGMIPGTFTVTSHIVITFTMALIVILTVVIFGLMKHGTHFLHLFVPSGVPGWLLPLIVIIEIISFLSRPVTLGLRLFANMLGGHIAMKVFGGFVASLLAAGGAYALLAPLPLVAIVALTALEFLVAFLQAYVFAVLASIYLNDALHPGH
ncbi:MAG: F0F1 ATP synthase subunit A [Beijerinckiaceae bacterium]